MTEKSAYTQNKLPISPNELTHLFRWVDVDTITNTMNSPAIGYMPYSLASTRYGEMPNVAIVFCIYNVIQKPYFLPVLVELSMSCWVLGNPNDSYYKQRILKKQ